MTGSRTVVPATPDLWRMDTLAELVSWAAACHREKVAWVFGGNAGDEWTFTQIDQAVRRLAVWLQERCPEPGSRVAVMVPNRAEFPLTWLACAVAGRVMVPVNIRSRSSDTEHVLRDGDVSLVVTTPELRTVIDSVVGRLDRAPQIVEVGELPIDRCDPSPAPQPPPTGTRIVNIQYTSGTTGLPKGCMLSHRYWLEIAHSLCHNHPRVTAADTLYTAQPFSYIDPQWHVVTALLAGARLVVAERFSAHGMWADVRRNGVTLFYCLGIMPGALLAQPARVDDRVHTVRAVLASGIPAQIHADLEARWGVPWYEAFGMTESGADLVVGPEDHDAAVGTACLGRPHRGREVAVVDPAGEPVPTGTSGELVIRGVGLMDGYWRQPESTAAAFRNGWLRSGDQAMMDEQGRFYFLGRFKDIVRRSGENVSALEVESVVEQHESVARAAVVPHPDLLAGEEVKVFVVLQPGHDDGVIADVHRYCAQRLASFKVPRYWGVRPDLPMTPSERVAKAELRRDSGHLRDMSEPRTAPRR